MTRRSKGIILLIVGCILLLISGGWYIYNVQEDKNAGRQATEILGKLDNEQNIIDNSDTAPVITVDGDAFCGKASHDVSRYLWHPEASKEERHMNVWLIALVV